jgi:hypothetical protein
MDLVIAVLLRNLMQYDYSNKQRFGIAEAFFKRIFKY